MRKPKTNKDRKKEYVRISELAELCGVRYSTIKFYSELGLIPFKQEGERLAKHYHAKEASKRLKEILRLREKGKSITEVISYLLKQK